MRQHVRTGGHGSVAGCSQTSRSSTCLRPEVRFYVSPGFSNQGMHVAAKLACLGGATDSFPMHRTRLAERHDVGRTLRVRQATIVSEKVRQWNWG